MMDRALYLAIGFLAVAASSCTAYAPLANAQEAPSLHLHIDGLANPISQGQVVKIQWSAAHVPRGAEVTLWLRKTATGHLVGPLASDLPSSGHYHWHIPVFQPHTRRCARDRTGGCINDINPGTRYAIIARLHPVSDGVTSPEIVASSESSEFLMLRKH